MTHVRLPFHKKQNQEATPWRMAMDEDGTALLLVYMDECGVDTLDTHPSIVATNVLLMEDGNQYPSQSVRPHIGDAQEGRALLSGEYQA